MAVSPFRLGLMLGALLALFHAAWAAMVAAGFAQPLMDFIFWAHFLTPPYHVEPFALARAAILVAVTFGVGLVLGTIAGLIWNGLVKRARQ
jgi:hypothetical protein